MSRIGCSFSCTSDWGHAKDYIKGMWLMVQRDEPSDYVLSTGECHSVKEFVEEASTFPFFSSSCQLCGTPLKPGLGFEGLSDG